MISAEHVFNVIIIHYIHSVLNTGFALVFHRNMFVTSIKYVSIDEKCELRCWHCLKKCSLVFFICLAKWMRAKKKKLAMIKLVSFRLRNERRWNTLVWCKRRQNMWWQPAVWWKILFYCFMHMWLFFRDHLHFKHLSTTVWSEMDVNQIIYCFGLVSSI